MTTTASNQSLLDGSLDAIIVPTNRPPECLSYAFALASNTKALLLVLCSGRASATDTANSMTLCGVKGLAVDIPTGYRHVLFSSFESDNFSDALLDRAANDIGPKRNLGLILSRIAGWNKILFLDDDISGLKGDHRAISPMPKMSAAGFLISEFPDNSVVRHAERLSGREPGVRLTGSALMVNVAATAAFFPHIYNEDWFFLYGMGNERRDFLCLGTGRQRHYDPFKDITRAISEEFGDLTAEGILQLREAGIDYLQISKSDWQHLLAKRMLLLENICNKLRVQAHVPQSRMAISSLEAARTRLTMITPQSCVDYIAAWGRDLNLFRERFALLPNCERPIVQIIEAEGLLPIPANLE